MPDLMTHLGASYLVKRFLWPDRQTLAFLAGATLPDLAAYVPLVAANLLGFSSGPAWLRDAPYFFLPFHSLLGFTLLCWLISLLFTADERRGVFLNLEAAGLLHFALDVFQIQHGEFGYLLFPVSWKPVQLGWIGTETSLYVLPGLAAVCLMVFCLDWRRQTRSQRGD